MENLPSGLRAYAAELLRYLNRIEFGDPSELVRSRCGVECDAAALSQVWEPPTVQAAAPEGALGDSSLQPGIDLPLEPIVLSTQRNVHLLLAGPGSGKTTVCRFFACKLATLVLESGLITHGTPLPIYVSLRFMPTGDVGAEEAFAAAAIASMGHVPNPREVREMIAERLASTFLILDGLDELPGRHEEVAGASSAMAHIEYILRAYPKIRVLMTCREYDYRADSQLHLPGASILSLSLFAPEQVYSAIRRWHSAAVELGVRYNCTLGDFAQRGEQLIQALLFDRELSELARVPLLLNIMQAMFGQYERLPRSVARLCERAITFLTLDRPRERVAAELSRGGPSEIANFLGSESRFYVLRVLEALAYELQAQLLQDGKRSVEIQDLERTATRVLDAESIDGYRKRGQLVHPTVSHLLAGHGVLVEAERDTVCFSHNVFREVLAGKFLGAQPSSVISEHAGIDHWHGPIRYWAGLHSSTRDGMAAVLSMAEELFTLWTADEVVGYALIASEMLAETLVEPPGGAPSAQATRLRDLFIPALIGILARPDLPLDSRLRTGDALGRLGDPRIAPDRTWLAHAEAWSVQLAEEDTDIGRTNPHRVNAQKYAEVPCSPVRRVQIDRYRLGRYPVTNQEYRLFIEAGGYNEERYWTTAASRKWLTQDAGFIGELAEKIRQTALKHFNTEINAGRMAQGDLPDISDKMVKRNTPLYWGDPRFNRPNQPVVGINWWEARAFCTWVEEVISQRYPSSHGACRVDLPTEFEWERAARHDDQRPYPWGSGDPMYSGLFSINADKAGRSAAVGSFPWATWSGGPLDMAGNVWEWTRSRPFPYSSEHDPEREVTEGLHDRIVRGSSWLSAERESPAATFRSYDPSCNAYEDLGFRIAIYGME
jgi:formylglycine-generating enzyme required for sulfatase activity